MEASAILTSLHGCRCTNVRLVAGGSLILYFHDATVEPTLPAKWTLHLEPAWRLHDDSQPLMGSFDTPTDGNETDRWLSQLEKLRGREVQGVQIGSPVVDLTIRFANGYLIQTFAHSVADGENWELRSVDDDGLGMASGDICSLTPSNPAPESDTTS